MSSEEVIGDTTVYPRIATVGQIQHTVEHLDKSERKEVAKTLAAFEPPAWMKATVRGLIFGGVYSGLTFFTFAADMSGYEQAALEAGKALFSYLVLRIAEGGYDQIKNTH